MQQYHDLPSCSSNEYPVSRRKSPICLLTGSNLRQAILMMALTRWRAEKTIGSSVFQTADHQDGVRSSQRSLPPQIAAASQDSLVRQMAQQLQQQYNWAKLTKTQPLILSQWGQHQLVRVISDDNQFELGWLTAIKILKVYFWDYLQRNLYRTIWLCLIAATIALILGKLILGKLAADCVVQPLSKLRQVRQAIADGNLTTRLLEINIMQETQGTARALNQMATQLELSSQKIKW